MTQPINLYFSGGMNNDETALNLFVRQRGETAQAVNFDTSQRGRLTLSRPLATLNTGSNVLSGPVYAIYAWNDNVYVVNNEAIKRWNGTEWTTLFSGVTNKWASMVQIGDWLYFANGSQQYMIYLGGTPICCKLGQSPPKTAPTVADAAVAGNPDGTYTCYYRYKITLPDGTILRTGLSPSAEVTVVTNKIAWSNLVHVPDFFCSHPDEVTRQIELFRYSEDLADTYLVTTLDEGTTTYTDDEDDTTIDDNDVFAEDDYYAFPDGLQVLQYLNDSDRLIAVSENDVYWSEPSLYWVCAYDSTADEYANVNSVFLKGEKIRAMVSIDEQLYFSSRRTWIRLRGSNPSSWSWERTPAKKGAVNQASVCVTPWGAVYPGNDGYMWLFNGMHTAKIFEQFIFPVIPGEASHATFDGRYIRLFYEYTTYPMVMFDTQGGISAARVTQCSHQARCSYYDEDGGTLYWGTANGYIKAGRDTSTELTALVTTCEIPVEQLLKLGDYAKLVARLNTAGAEVVITPVYDGVLGDVPLETVETSEMRFIDIPLQSFSYRTLAFYITTTTNRSVVLQEPWILSPED